MKYYIQKYFAILGFECVFLKPICTYMLYSIVMVYTLGILKIIFYVFL